jgi:outer membrane lipoprotein carrier protein
MKGISTLLTAFLAISLWGQSPEETAEKVEKTLRSLESFQAGFAQVYYSSSVSTPLEEFGQVYYRRPGWMRWDYLEPEKKSILVKGREIVYYFPEDNQVLYQSAGESERESNIISLLTGDRSILEDYSIEPAVFPASGSDIEQIKLIPKNEDESESYVLLEIDKDSYFIKKAVFFDWTGNKQEFLFTEVKTGIPLSEGIFELNLPPGVEVIKSPSPE